MLSKCSYNNSMQDLSNYASKLDVAEHALKARVQQTAQRSLASKTNGNKQNKLCLHCYNCEKERFIQYSVT